MLVWSVYSTDSMVYFRWVVYLFYDFAEDSRIDLFLFINYLLDLYIRFEDNLLYFYVRE